MFGGEINDGKTTLTPNSPILSLDVSGNGPFTLTGQNNFTGGTIRGRCRCKGDTMPCESAATVRPGIAVIVRGGAVFDRGRRARKKCSEYCNAI